MKRFFVSTLATVFIPLVLLGDARAADAGSAVFSETNDLGSVVVTQSRNGLSRTLILDGRVIGRTGDLSARRAHYPLLLHPGPRRVLIMDMATGASAAAALEHDIDRADVVIRNPAIIKAADWFLTRNRKALDSPRLKTIISQPLKWVQKAAGGYDVILAGHTLGGVHGRAPELTYEHFKRMGKLLAGGGLMAQWIPLGSLTWDDIRSVVAAFDKAFARVTIWNGDINPVRSWLLLLGSREPIEIDPAKVHERLAAVSGSGDMVEGENAYSFLSFYITNEDSIGPLLSGVPSHSLSSPAIAAPGSGGKAQEAANRSTRNFTLWSDYRKPVTIQIKTGGAVAQKLKSYFRARSKIIKGRIVGVAGKTSEELSWYDKALADAPEEPHLGLYFFLIGKAYYKNGLLSQAAVLLEKAKKISPSQPAVRFYLGKTYEKMSRYPEAEREFKKLKELSPGYFERPVIVPRGAVKPIS